MTGNELWAILPLIVLATGIVVLMLMVSFIQNIHYAYGLTQGVLLVAIVTFLVFTNNVIMIGEPVVSGFLIVDYFTVFFSELILVSTMIVAFFINEDVSINIEKATADELFHSYTAYYLMLLLAAFGALIVVSSIHFAVWFLGMEILVVSLYGMLAFHPSRQQNIALRSVVPFEASLKFLILSALSTSFMLFGFAMLYGASGTLRFDEYYLLNHIQHAAEHFIVIGGVAMIMVGMGYKLSLVPFHQWTPDVYQGAPTLITGYLATVSKAVMLVILIRFFMFSGVFLLDRLLMVVAIMALLSMVVGNVLALNQNNIKRLLAYSSVAHMGYLLIAFIAASFAFQQQGINFDLAVEAITYYLVAYFLMTLSSFLIIHVVSDRTTREERDSADVFSINYYSGLLWRSPWIGGGFIVCLLSLAGIPLTAGFIGKFYLFASGITEELWVLLGALIIGSVIGLYYYVNLILVIVRHEDKTQSAKPLIMRASSGGLTVLASLLVLILVLGLYPDPMIEILPAIDGGITERVFSKVDN